MAGGENMIYKPDVLVEGRWTKIPIPKEEKKKIRVLETIIYYPVYCRDCQYIWYVKTKDGKVICPRCVSIKTIKHVFGLGN